MSKKPPLTTSVVPLPSASARLTTKLPLLTVSVMGWTGALTVTLPLDETSSPCSTAPTTAPLLSTDVVDVSVPPPDRVPARSSAEMVSKLPSDKVPPAATRTVAALGNRSEAPSTSVPPALTATVSASAVPLSSTLPLMFKVPAPRSASITAPLCRA